jgi:D-lactate dehydrogenase
MTSLRELIDSSRIKDKYIDRVSYASDAGFYYLVPKAVVQPNSEEEIIRLFNYSRQNNIPLVFRGGGTSLSGQSITDGILVDLSRFWKKVGIENDANQVRVQPGITGAMVNAQLKKFSKKIGPDPSSIGAAMMGGILSNNASGMCCGVTQNSYHTVRYIRFIMPDGKVFSTENTNDYSRFETECKHLSEELLALKAKILDNPFLKERITQKYKTKNTVGYSLNAFLDFDKPLDIFAHLLIGGEGTLAFIAEAVLDTVPDKSFKSTGLLYFTDIFSACQAIQPLIDTGAAMVELMDRASLASVENMDGMPAIVKTLPPAASALLVEFQEDTIEDLQKTVAKFESNLSDFSLVEMPEFTQNPAQQAFYWKVRKGLFPAVGAVRASGTTVILEDVAFPLHHLGQAIIDIQDLFKKHRYDNGIIFGHAKDGNIHFVVTQTFKTEREIDRYNAFILDVVDLVVKKYDGALKAEHGTGRNMSPFVETEWGSEAFEIMQRLKKAVDPENILNPGVIINEHPDAHLRDLKQMPSVEEEVDKCIECGFCEPSCPSRQLTASPRRRIVIRRVLENLKSEGKLAEYHELNQQFQYDGLDTCAVDGLCAVNCPVDINTGDLVKRLRVDTHSVLEKKLAVQTAKNFDSLVSIMRFGVESGHSLNAMFGQNTMKAVTQSIKKLFKTTPLWSNQISKSPILKYRKDSGADIVYFPSCITRMMGTHEGKSKNLIETFYSVCDKAGLKTTVIEKVESSCCSQIYSSKGFKDAYELKANEVVERMWASSDGGKLPVVIDVTSCDYTLKHIFPVLNVENKSRYTKLTIWDSVEFLYKMVLPRVDAKAKKDKIVLHPVCSLEKMKTKQLFIDIAEKFAEEVVVPLNAGCCGMAGDRGFLLPELTASATLLEAEEVRGCSDVDGYYSSTKTCEMAMSEAVGKDYESILYLVDEGL